eukprot:594953-Pyramimonas_sp.AAC.1
MANAAASSLEENTFKNICVFCGVRLLRTPSTRVFVDTNHNEVQPDFVNRAPGIFWLQASKGTREEYTAAASNLANELRTNSADEYACKSQCTEHISICREFTLGNICRSAVSLRGWCLGVGDQVKRNIGLVYGGGSVGLMGTISTTVGPHSHLLASSHVSSRPGGMSSELCRADKLFYKHLLPSWAHH